VTVDAYKEVRADCIWQ